MKKILFLIAICLLFLVIGGQWSVISGQEVKGQKSEVKDASTSSAQIEGYEQYNAIQKIDDQLASVKNSFDQRVQEIKYVLGLIGITSEATIKEAMEKDATCLRLDTAMRVFEDQKKQLAGLKIFKKLESAKETLQKDGGQAADKVKGEKQEVKK